MSLTHIGELDMEKIKLIGGIGMTITSTIDCFVEWNFDV